MENTLGNKVRIYLLYIIFFVLCCYVLSLKQDFHVDELLNYNLANAESWLCPEDGKKYTPADQLFVDALVSNGTFDLRHVWKQQANDTHPPFYYVLVHAICTLFPGSVSIWYAGVINIIFIILTLFVYRKLLKILVGDESIEYILSLAFCLSAGVLSIVSFLRMYVMAMFLVTTFTYVIINNIEHFGRKEYILLAIITVLGALTHYYYIVYAFFTSAVLTIIMLFQKRFKELLTYAATMGMAGGMTYFIFPSIVSHLFERGRGAQSIENLKTSNFGDQFKIYIDIINTKLFGGLLGFVMTIVVILLLLDFIFSDRQNEEVVCHFERIQAYRYLCMLIPALFYVILVSKSAPFNTDRYISPIYAVGIAGIWSLLYLCLKNVYFKVEIRNAMYTGLVVVVTLIGLMNCQWEYLNLGSKERLNNAFLYGNGSEAIVLYDIAWEINPYYREISCCDSSVFYRINEYQQFSETVSDEDLPDDITFFLIGMDADGFINDFLSAHSDYTIILDNGEGVYGHSYYLKKGD